MSAARFISRPSAALAVALALAVGGGLLTGPAQAQQICAADLNGSGSADDPGEVATCEAANDGGAWLCPLSQVPCTADAAGAYSCPLGAAHQCLTLSGSSVPQCSPSACTEPTGAGVTDDPVFDDPGAPADGQVDAAGNCLGSIEIFAGRALRCRPPGLRTTFSDCCKDRGKIVHDGMGSSLSSLQTKVTVAKGVFTGMKAAYAAFQAGATGGQAASAGANAIIVGIDPTSIAISLAINFMFEFLLSGCDSQDMEVGMLRGSGMCHEVGTWCSGHVLGICIQKSKGHCCFNTKLGRIIQEQGRPQLTTFNAVGWGTPQRPYCRGFTPEEFQALDFSKMDLSEYYADIEAREQAEIQVQMKGKIDGFMQTIGQ
jgi:conjugal transfer mating pair stabilization protein TraN